MRKCAGVALFLVGIVLLPGCGKSTMAPVKGCVTFKGKPVANASVQFNPVPKSESDKESGKPATGFTDEEGNFVLSTYKKLDGALIGKHQVIITVDDAHPIKCKRRTEITLEVNPGDNELNIKLEPYRKSDDQ